MKDFYFTFRSMTEAQQAAFALLQYGLEYELVKAPVIASNMGCSHAVRVEHSDSYQASMILRREGLSYERGLRVRI